MTTTPYDFTLRDWFAGQALTSMADTEGAAKAARLSYEYADAMLAARTPDTGPSAIDAAEREACAQVAYFFPVLIHGSLDPNATAVQVATEIAAAIRARTPSPTPTDRHPYDDGPRFDCPDDADDEW